MIKLKLLLATIALTAFVLTANSRSRAAEQIVTGISAYDTGVGWKPAS